MRENRPYGSEGGEGLQPFPTPIVRFDSLPEVPDSLAALGFRDDGWELLLAGITPRLPAT
jgi:hypothetical protein